MSISDESEGRTAALPSSGSAISASCLRPPFLAQFLDTLHCIPSFPNECRVGIFTSPDAFPCFSRQPRLAFPVHGVVRSTGPPQVAWKYSPFISLISLSSFSTAFRPALPRVSFATPAASFRSFRRFLRSAKQFLLAAFSAV